jgi:3-phosphoshikimate 1-carboxyvinyltransferase
VFRREGRLAQRPLEPLLSVLRAHGMTLREDGPLLFCEGGLQPGEYSIDGGVSSQFVTGLLYALTLLGDSSLHVTGTAVSAPYVELTMEYIRLARAAPETTPDGWAFRTPRRFALPDRVSCEGDWSNAAPFLCIGALSPEGVTVTGLRTDSAQGDRAVVEALRSAGAVVEVRTDAVTVRRGALRGFRFDAEQTPDLVPALAALSACIDGPSEFVHAARLREKESDRLSSTASLLRALGAEVAERPDGQAIRGGRLVGGTADAAGDHRIAMAAAVAACGCTGDVTLRGAECVEKSYPEFWKELSCLSM